MNYRAKLSGFLGFIGIGLMAICFSSLALQVVLEGLYWFKNGAWLSYSLESALPRFTDDVLASSDFKGLNIILETIFGAWISLVVFFAGMSCTLALFKLGEKLEEKETGG